MLNLIRKLAETRSKWRRHPASAGLQENAAPPLLPEQTHEEIE